MKILLKNLSEIISCSSKNGFIPLGYEGKIKDEGDLILIEDGKIKRVGKGREAEICDAVYDCSGKIALPGFVDAHTHLVFHGTREDEFRMRTQGLAYKEIAASGGGIRKSVRMTREVSEDELYEESAKKLEKFLLRGVTSIEIKSGYGLDRETELKQLRVIKNLKKRFKMNVKATYLGAHEMPDEYRGRREEYIRFMTDEMMPMISQEKLADYADVFCEKGVYTEDEAVRILEAGQKYGLASRIHADEIDFSGGSTAAARVGAKSVDHFNIPSVGDLKKLRDNNTVITLLPATNFLLRIKTIPPIDEMRKAGNTVAVSTDFNPGSSPVISLLLASQIGMVNYRLLPEELLPAMTINPAYSLSLSGFTGSIEEGKDADIVVFDRKNLNELFYRFGEDAPEMVFCKGERVGG